MKLCSKTDRTVVIEMSHEQAIMIVSLVRETCFGTVMHGFETRVGHPPEKVGGIALELKKLLDSADIVE